MLENLLFFIVGAMCTFFFPNQVQAVARWVRVKWDAFSKPDSTGDKQP